MTVDEVKRTPLYDAHLALRARLVDFAGWLMPIQYTGILDEARAVRTAAGIFDVSHMGRVRVTGSGSVAFLQTLTTNDVEAIQPGSAQYSLLTNPEGGVIDDIIVYREAPGAYLIVVNASNAAKDLAWFERHRPNSVTMDDLSAQTAMFAVQGPEAIAALERAGTDADALRLGRFQHGAGSVAGVPATLCRTGYTGEDGFEIIVPAEGAIDVWNALVAAGVLPCGLGARDVLRIEAGYPLYGHELDDRTGPAEAGLMWAVSLDKGFFHGRDAIARTQAGGPSRRLVGLRCDDRIVPRQGYTVFAGNEPAGEITSGAFSPTLGRSIAMAFLHPRYSKTGNTVAIGIRDKRVVARIVPKKALIKQD